MLNREVPVLFSPRARTGTIPVEWRKNDAEKIFERIDQVGERELSIETGKVAKQADGSVIIRYGDTMLLVAAVSGRTMKEGLDFFPLTVEYREAALFGGANSGQLFPPRRPPERKGNHNLPLDRPPGAPAVSRWIPFRNTDCRFRDIGRCRKTIPM